MAEIIEPSSRSCAGSQSATQADWQRHFDETHSVQGAACNQGPSESCAPRSLQHQDTQAELAFQPDLAHENSQWRQEHQAQKGEHLQIDQNGMHTVQPGETIYDIAQRYLRDQGRSTSGAAINNEVSAIVANNIDAYPGLRQNAALIQPGWQLRITGCDNGPTHVDVPPAPYPQPRPQPVTPPVSERPAPAPRPIEQAPPPVQTVPVEPAPAPITYQPPVEYQPPVVQSPPDQGILGIPGLGISIGTRIGDGGFFGINLGQPGAGIINEFPNNGYYPGYGPGGYGGWGGNSGYYPGYGGGWGGNSGYYPGYGGGWGDGDRWRHRDDDDRWRHHHER